MSKIEELLDRLDQVEREQIANRMLMINENLKTKK